MKYTVYLNYITDPETLFTAAGDHDTAVESGDATSADIALYLMHLCWSGYEKLWASDDPDTEDAILDPKLALELDTAGSFTFSVIPGHKHYDHFDRMTSLVKVVCDNDVLFVGRVLNIETDLWKTRKVTCEGLLAVLNDSLQPPETTERSLTVAQRFADLISVHNNQMDGISIFKRLEAGTVTVSDDVTLGESSESESTTEKYKNGSYRSVYDAIDNDLIKNHGGYLKIRATSQTFTAEYNGEEVSWTDDVYYVDYLKDYGGTNSQVIEFGTNLIEFTEGSSGENLFTSLIPVGSNNKRLSGLNANQKSALETYITNTYNGEYFITGDEICNSPLLKQYGYIVKSQSFSDISDLEELAKKAMKFFAANSLGTTDSYSVKAVDLHLLDSSSELLKIGDVITFRSSPHHIDRTLTITGVDYDLITPGNTSYNLGTPTQDLSFSKASTTSSGSGSGGGGYYGGSSFNPDSVHRLNNIEYIRAEEAVIHHLKGGDEKTEDWLKDSSVAFHDATFSNMDIHRDFRYRDVSLAPGILFLASVDDPKRDDLPLAYGIMMPVQKWTQTDNNVTIAKTPEQSLNHSHRISANDDGTVTIGDVVTLTSDERTFNIADTKFYTDSVAAEIRKVRVTPSPIVGAYDDTAGSILWPITVSLNNSPNIIPVIRKIDAFPAYSKGAKYAIDNATVSQISADANSSTGYTATVSHTIHGTTNSHAVDIDVSSIMPSVQSVVPTGMAAYDRDTDTITQSVVVTLTNGVTYTTELSISASAKTLDSNLIRISSSIGVTTSRKPDEGPGGLANINELAAALSNNIGNVRTFYFDVYINGDSSHYRRYYFLYDQR